MQSTKLWSKVLRILIGVLASSLVLSPVAMPANAGIFLSVNSTIEDSDENPSVVLTGPTFESDVDVEDFTIAVNQTGLTFESVTRDSDTQVTLVFSGVAHRGNIEITVLSSAYDGSVDMSFNQSVNAKLLPACSGTPTEPCVNAGTAAEADTTSRAFEIRRSNVSLSGGAYAALQFFIDDGSSSAGQYQQLSEGDTFADVEILYPTADAIGTDLETASFAMTAVDDFEFSKTVVDISGSEFVKWTVSFTARMTTNKDGCEKESFSFGAASNSVCQAENGEYINMVADSFDVFSPDTLSGMTSDSDGGFLVYVGSSFSWGSSETEPFQFQLVGPKFRPGDRSSFITNITDPTDVELNAGSLKIFLPTALANTLYGEDFDPVLTRKDNLSGTVVTNEMEASDGLVITQPAGGYLLEIASHPFSAPVFAVSSAVATTSAPAIYSGPILTRSSSKQVSAGDVVNITGERLSGITKVEIDGTEATVSNLTATGFDLLIPTGLSAGSKDLVVESSLGNLIYLDAFEIVVVVLEEVEQTTHSWTKKIDEATAKIYSKNIVGAGKVQFMFNGEEIAWVRAEDSSDPKLRIVGDANYLVRTVDLIQGQKNVLEVYLDGERVRRTAYSG